MLNFAKFRPQNGYLRGEYDDEKHVQFAHISLVHLLIINKDDKSMLN